MKKSLRLKPAMPAWKVLLSLGLYIFRNFPVVVSAYIVLKICEVAAQLIAAGAIAVLIQSSVSDTVSRALPERISEVVGEGVSAFVVGLSTSHFVILIALMLLLNVLMAYLARRILARTSIRVEENLAADVIATLKGMRYAHYRKIREHLNLDSRLILRLVQQNTRLTGIAARNLLGAAFTLFLMAAVFILLSIIDFRVTLVAVVSLILASVSLAVVFRFGMKHSQDFPASIPAATRQRQKFIADALSGDIRRSSGLRGVYLKSEPINVSLRHYENRFKILDLGELLTASLTALAFVLILGAVGGDGLSLSPFLIVAIIFIGNLLFQSLRRTSTLIVAIGRLYEQVQELWLYRTLSLGLSREAKRSVAASKKGDVIAIPQAHVDLHEAEAGSIKVGEILAICQHAPIDRMGLFLSLSTCFDISPEYESYFDDAFTGIAEDFDDYWNGIKPERQSWLIDNFTKVLAALDGAAIPPPMYGIDTLKNSAAFQNFVFMKQNKGVLLLPFSALKNVPADFFKVLVKGAASRQIILLGRSPAQGLKGYEDIVPSVVFCGSVALTMDTAEACKLQGLELQYIFNKTANSSGANANQSSDDLEGNLMAEDGMSGG